MANAPRDNNNVPVMLATSEADGSTPIPVQVIAATHILAVSDDTTGSDLSGDIVSRDRNVVTVLMGVSSVDGVTPTAIYAKITGELLITTV